MPACPKGNTQHGHMTVLYKLNDLHMYINNYRDITVGKPFNRLLND